MDEADLLARRFEENRATLRAVAQRMLGSAAEADDAVQEAWLRLSRSGADGVDNLGGWLTTVVGRVCLDMLRSRKSRREEPLDAGPAEPIGATGPADPEREAVLADAVGPALMVVLDALGPAERLAFVLHDLFAVPFDEIAAVLGRSPAATRQLASRARRRVQGVEPVPEADLVRRRAVVDAFLAAARDGDFAALVDLLDPDVEMRADQATVQMASGAIPASTQGQDAVARVFAGRAKALRRAVVDTQPGLVWTLRGDIKVAFAFTFDGDRIVGIEQVSDPATIEALAVEPLGGRVTG
jgi:RNA polymerase sigma factor (sigma-70 family)